MKEKALPEKEKSFSFYLLYSIGSIFINLLCVPLHEAGHAIIYMFQGYKVAFHFTKADPISGKETVLGSTGGVTVNILLALLFLFLFIKYKNILFYMFIAGNTLCSRVIGSIVAIFFMGRALEDETFFGKSVHINPVLIQAVILVITASIFVIATRMLMIQNTKRYSKYIIISTLIACIISLAVIAPLDARGL